MIGAWIGTLFFFFLSIVRFIPSQLLVIWIFSLMATEYGHYFALLGLLILVFWVRDWRKFVFFVPAIFLFFSPLVQLAQFDPNFRLNYLRLWQLFEHTSTPQTFTYAKPEGVDLKLDFYSPRVANKLTAKSPWILIVHGGAWKRGSEKEISEYSSELAEQGYGVVSVAYRLLPQFKWPAQQQDVFSAIGFVKAHAAEWGIDANRWVVLGRSAGAQLAQSVAYAKIDPSLKGCISFYGPSDLVFSYENGSENDILHSPRLLRQLMGGDLDQARSNFENASPLRFVSAQSPPTLLLHGVVDPIVWVKQSERLDEKLKSVGVYSKFVRIPWGTHGFDFNTFGPSGQLSAAAVSDFLKKVLPQ